MKTRTTHLQSIPRATSLLVLLVALIAALALGEPAGASTSAHPKHGTGLLLPTKQVNPKPTGRRFLATLPASIDLRNAADLAAGVGNQGPVASCVAWAIDYGMLGWYSRHQNKAGAPFNPMYTYSQIALHPETEDGGGSRPADALNIATTQGNDTQTHYMPQSGQDFSTKPDASEKANAANYKITGARTLFASTTGYGSQAWADLLKATLASGKPVAIGTLLRPGFSALWNLTPEFGVAGNDDNDTTGPLEKYSHEILAIGYDQYGVWFQNSWGPDYGNNGYGRLTWSKVAHDVFQAHTIDGFTAVGDSTKPKMSAVSEQLTTGRQLTSTTEQVTFNWSATDASGIGSYLVYVQTDGGSFYQDTSLAATATSVTYSLSIGHSYRLAVAASDTNGNWSSYSYGATVTPGVLDDTAFSANTSWTRYTLDGAFGGTYTAANKAGASRQLSFTGRDAALAAPKFSSAGLATVYCDGVSIGKIDLYSASTVVGQVVAQCHFAASAKHTMKVVVSGTSGRPWVGIDAFAYLS